MARLSISKAKSSTLHFFLRGIISSRIVIRHSWLSSKSIPFHPTKFRRHRALGEVIVELCISRMQASSEYSIEIWASQLAIKLG